MKKYISLLMIIICVMLLTGCNFHMHEFKTKRVEPTCDTKGYIEYTCACGMKAKNDFVPELGHKFSDWITTKEATEKETGSKERKCSVCNKIEIEEIAKIDHIHTYKETVIPVTCVTAGYTIFECECGYTKQDNYINPPDHTYSDWVVTVEPTEYSGGKKQKVCSVCGEKIVLDIEKLPHEHNYVKETIEVSCETEGCILYTCQCGDSYKENIVNPLGHNYSDWIVTKEPTEYESGTREKVCSNCNNKVIEEIERLPHDHKYEEQLVPPTCTEQGYTLHICKCKESYKDNYIEATGHTELYKVIKKASFEESGIVEYYCEKCNNYKETKTVSFFACKHSYKEKETYSNTSKQPGLIVLSCEFCVDEYGDLIVPNTTISQPTMSLSEYSLLASNKALQMAEANFKNAINKNQKELFMYPYMELSNYKKVREFTLELIKNCKSEEDKAHEIYKWIIDNLNYDTSAMTQSIYDSFVNKKAVCFGYASLLHDMLSAAGIMSSYISGYTSYNSLSYNDVFAYNNNPNCHAWIYAYVNNKVLIMDPTWADGYSSETYGFDMDINKMYKTHMVISVEEIHVVPENVDYRLYSNIFYTIGDYTFLVNKGKADLTSSSIPLYYKIHRNSVLELKFATSNSKFAIHDEKDLLGCINKNGFYCASSFNKTDVNEWSYSICNGLALSIKELSNYIKYLNSNGYNIKLDVPDLLKNYFD